MPSRVRQSKDWNYHPDLPLADGSVFRWPPKAGFIARWFARNWLTLSERVMMVLLAVALWLWVYPDFSHLWVSNFALVAICAGALHWYFFMRKAQGTALKFDKRDMARGNRLWSFANQVHDNMFWSLGSGVFFLTLFSALTMWLMANGYAPSITPLSNPAASCAVPLYERARAASSQRQRRPMVRLFHASCRTPALLLVALHPLDCPQ